VADTLVVDIGLPLFPLFCPSLERRSKGLVVGLGEVAREFDFHSSVDDVTKARQLQAFLT